MCARLLTAATTATATATVTATATAVVGCSLCALLLLFWMLVAGLKCARFTCCRHDDSEVRFAHLC